MESGALTTDLNARLEWKTEQHMLRLTPELAVSDATTASGAEEVGTVLRRDYMMCPGNVCGARYSGDAVLRTAGRPDLVHELDVRRTCPTSINVTIVGTGDSSTITFNADGSITLVHDPGGEEEETRVLASCEDLEAKGSCN